MIRCALLLSLIFASVIHFGTCRVARDKITNKDIQLDDGKSVNLRDSTTAVENHQNRKVSKKFRNKDDNEDETPCKRTKLNLNILERIYLAAVYGFGWQLLGVPIMQEGMLKNIFGIIDGSIQPMKRKPGCS